MSTVNRTTDRYGNTSNEALQATKSKGSSSAKNKMGLDMEDFLLLMVKQMQSQTMDNTADTSDMLNQLVQMQMVEALVNMTDASIMTYSASLVGKEVTVGTYDSDGNLKEIVGTVTATGTYDGEQVVYVNGEMYRLSEIMAVGALPAAGKPETEDIIAHLEKEGCLDIVEKMQKGEEISYIDFRVLLRELKDCGAITEEEHNVALSCRENLPDGYKNDNGKTITYEGKDRFNTMEVWTTGMGDPVEYLEEWLDMVTGWYGELNEAKNEDGTDKYSNLMPVNEYLDRLGAVASQLKELETAKIETDNDTSNKTETDNNTTETGGTTGTETVPESGTTPETGTETGGTDAGTTPGTETGAGTETGSETESGGNA